MSDDQLFSLLRWLVLLLFISSGLVVASRYPSRLGWWMRRGAVVLFAIAAAYALVLVFLWLMGL